MDRELNFNHEDILNKMYMIGTIAENPEIRYNALKFCYENTMESDEADRINRAKRISWGDAEEGPSVTDISPHEYYDALKRRKEAIEAKMKELVQEMNPIDAVLLCKNASQPNHA